jgi:hypothetical protein
MPLFPGEPVMTDKPEHPPEVFWSPSQRRAIIALLCVLLVVLVVRFSMNRGFISDPQPPLGSRAGELATRIDPNTADWQTLAAIPRLGQKRAREIVTWREQARAANPGRTLFTGPDDLLQIHGIGPATAENLRPYLMFPAGGQSSTRP